MDYFKKIFTRSKSYPGCTPDNIQNKHETDDIMEVRVCTAAFCETCEEMVFQTLRKCEDCGERKICWCCYDDDKKLCVKCYGDLMSTYNKIEKDMCKKKKAKKSLKNAKKIVEYVDQLL